MPDEFYERYRKLSHQELYRLLMLGSPAQVDRVADGWRAIETALDDAAARLRRDLAKMLPDWHGPGSREFQYRIGLVAAYAQKLADEAAAIRTGLAVMAAALADSQRLAEPDQQPSTGDFRLAAVLGPELGHAMVEEEQTRARERIATLVAQLSADYTTADHRRWPATLPAVPVDMPGTEGLASAAALNPLAAPPPVVGGPGLAGTGDFRAPAGGVPPALAPLPAAMLGGAAPGLLGAPPAIAPGSRSTDSRASGQAPAGGAGAGMAPMAGMGMAGRPAGDYPVNDPRLIDDGTAWSSAETIAWGDESDPPPHVLGG